MAPRFTSIIIRLAIVFGLGIAAHADGINTSGNVGDGGSVGMHEGITIPGVAVAFVPSSCPNSLDFSQACDSQYFTLGIL